MHHTRPSFLARVARNSLCCLALLAALPAAQAKDEVTPLLLDANFNVAKTAETAFTIADTKALKGVTRVAIPVFTVEFATAESVSAQTSGFAAAGRASSSMYYKLLGVGEAEFQAITDALYLQFQQELKASGLELVAPEQLQAAAAYGKLKAGATPAPIKSDSAMLMSAPGLAVYGFTRTAASNSSKGLFGAIAGMGAGFAAVGAISDSLELSKQLNAALLEVRLNVSFAQLESSGKGFLARLTDTASTSGKAFPSVSGLSASVIHNSTSSSIVMRHSLTLDASAYAEVREKATTTADVAGAVAVGLLRLAIGSNDSSSSTEMEVVADPAKYRAVVGAGLGTAGSLLVARLKTER